MSRFMTQRGKRLASTARWMIGALLLGAAASTAADVDVEVKSLSQSLMLIERLLNQSSVARNVAQVQHPVALGYMRAARRLHEEAVESLNLGDLDNTRKAKDDALRLMMMAGRLASKAAGEVQLQRKSDYETRLRSVEALLEAHRRITSEKGNRQAEEQLSASVVESMNAAQRHAAVKEYEQALGALNQAYALVATSIQAQRTGETLIRSLDFATAEEEYDYELGRYQNYLMLVNMLIDERQSVQMTERLAALLDEAKGLFQQAEQQARRSEFETAVGSLMQASARLVAFIRASGIHIPG